MLKLRQAFVVRLAFMVSVCTVPSSGGQTDVPQASQTVLSIASVLPSYDASSHQITEAVRLAVNESTPNTPPEVRIVAQSQYLPKLIEDQGLLDNFLTQLRNPHAIGAIGLSSASTIEFLAAVIGQLEAPVITTSMSPRKAWSDVYYSTLLYAAPANDLMAMVVKDIFQRFSWTTVCAIYSNDFSSLPTLKDFITRIGPLYGVVVAKSVLMQFDNSGAIRSASAKSVSDIARAECNIFVVGVNAQQLLPVMRVAQENNLLLQGTGWLFMDFLTAPFLMPNELLGYMEGALLIRPRSVDANDQRLLNFADRLKRFNSSVFPCVSVTLDCVSLEAAYAYWATLQLSKTLQTWATMPIVAPPAEVAVHENLSLSVLPNGQKLMDLLRQTSWDGVLGMSSFSGSSHKHGYDVFNLREQKLVRVGSWSVTLSALDKIKWTGETAVTPEGRLNITKSLHILVPDAAPFSYLLRKPPRKNKDFAGVAVDILDSVAQMAGFNYTLHLWEKTWDEMVKAAGDVDNKYDMAIGSISLKKNRISLCNFTRTIYLTGLKLLIHRPGERPTGYWDFLHPFHWSVWLALIGVILFSAVVMQILDPEGIATERTGHWYFDALFFTTNVFLFVHDADNINPKLARAFLIFLQFLMHIMCAAYTANMASFLSAQSNEVEVSTYSDLLHDNVGCRNGTTNWLFAKNGLGLRHLYDVKSNEGAVAALRAKRVKAYIADIPDLDIIAAQHCDLIVVGNRVDTQEYAFAMRKNSPWLSEINRALSTVINNGIVSKNYDRHLKTQCPPLTREEGVKSLDLSNLGSLFVVGLITAAAMAIAKLLLMWHGLKNHKLTMRALSTTRSEQAGVSHSEAINRKFSAMSSYTVTNQSGLTEASVLSTSLRDACLKQRDQKYKFKEHVVYLN